MMTELELTYMRDLMITLRNDLIMLGNFADSENAVDFGYELNEIAATCPIMTHRQKFHYAKLKAQQLQACVLDLDRKLHSMKMQNDGGHEF